MAGKEGIKMTAASKSTLRGEKNMCPPVGQAAGNVLKVIFYLVSKKTMCCNVFHIYKQLRNYWRIDLLLLINVIVFW